MLCAVAPSTGWLLFARVLQGVGAGLVLSCAPVLVTGLYPEARRSHAIGIFTLIYSIGQAMGPLIGGVIVARWGWPAVFWFRAPIAFVALLLWRGAPTAAQGGSGERFDGAGAILLAAGLIGLLFAVNALPLLAVGNYRAVPAGVIAIASIAGFIWWEGRAARPMVRLDLFRDRRFALINLSNILIYLTNFSLMLLVPFYFSRITTLPLPVAGVVLAMGSVGMLAASTPAGWLVARYGSGKVAPAGAFLVATGLCWVGFWGSGTSAGTMVAAQLVQGIGPSASSRSRRWRSSCQARCRPGAARRSPAQPPVMLTPKVIRVVTAASVLAIRSFMPSKPGALVGGAGATPAPSSPASREDLAASSRSSRP